MQKENSIVKSFLRGSAISFVGVIVIGLLNLLIRRTLVGNLTQIEYGFFYSVFAFMGIFLSFLDLGIGQTTTILISKYLAKNKKNKVQSIFSAVFYVKLILSSIFVLILYFSTDFLLTYYFKFPDGNKTFLILCFLIPAIALEGLMLTTLDGFQKFGIKVMLVMFKVTLTLLIIIFFIDKIGFNAAAYSFVISSLFVIFSGYLYLKYKYKLSFISKFKETKNIIKEIAHFSKWVAISVAGLSIMYQMDSFMLTYLSGLESVGEYNIALPITQILQSLLILPVIFTPIASKMWQEKNLAQLKSITYNASLCLIWIIFPILISLIFLSGGIIKILLTSQEYAQEAKYALIILGSGIPLFAIAQFYISTLNSMEKPAKVARIVMIGVISNVLLNFYLIPYFNIEGAAFATVGAYLIIAIFAIKTFNKEVNFKISSYSIIMIIIFGTIISYLAYYIGEQVSLWKNILYAGSAILIYISLTIYYFIPIIKEMFNIIRKK